LWQADTVKNRFLNHERYMSGKTVFKSVKKSIKNQNFQISI
jgi:hypothetical protein